MDDDYTQGLPRAQQDAPGWVLGGRYRIVDRLGVGGMAEVFRAHDELLDRDVAIKVFRTPIDDGDEAAAARRQLELQSLARLNHPNLITLYDGSVADERPAYLVLELVTGRTLADRLADVPLSVVEARIIGAQLADALAYVHAHGVVHRDVKPANILLGTDANAGDTTATDLREVRARLSDFGIVRIIGSERMTAVDLTVGTAWYVAPEQARGADVEPPADVYALGLVLLEAVTGARAFDGPIHETLAARLVAPPAVPRDLPAPWPALLVAMTALDPAARPTAAQVAQALRGEPAAITAPTALAAPPLFGPPPASGAMTSVTGVHTGAPLLAAAASGLAAPRVAGLPVNEPATSYTSVVEPRTERHSTGRTGLLIAACLLFLLIIGGGAWFLLHSNGPSSPSDSPPASVGSSTPSVGTASRTTARSSSAASTSAGRASSPRSSSARTSSRAPSTPPSSPSTRPSSSPSSPSRPSSSAPSTSASSSPASSPASSSPRSSSAASSAASSSASAAASSSRTTVAGARSSSTPAGPPGVAPGR